MIITVDSRGKTDSKKSVRSKRSCNRTDIIGKKVGSMVVVSYSHNNPKPNFGSFWNCLCKCGNITKVPISKILSNSAKTCIKCQSEDKKLPNRNHALYKTWSNIKNRCLNQNYKKYHNWGGRGIKVYEKWVNDYDAFFEYAIRFYVKGLQIDRIDNDGDYEPGNIRWVDIKSNNRNRPHTRLTESDVLEIRKSNIRDCELAKTYSVKPCTIWSIRNRKIWKDI